MTSAPSGSRVGLCGGEYDARQQTSKDTTVYHSVKPDDPSFPAPIYANLVAVDDGYALVRSR